MAMTDVTTSMSTMPSSDSWSDDNNSDQPDYAAMIKERDSSKVIPPRPSQSRWQEEDFLKVIWVWDLSQEEIDAILDKISERGYESLSKEEKQKLFNASK